MNIDMYIHNLSIRCPRIISEEYVLQIIYCCQICEGAISDSLVIVPFQAVNPLQN
jgi:hypothetical protein